MHGPFVMLRKLREYGTQYLPQFNQPPTNSEFLFLDCMRVVIVSFVMQNSFFQKGVCMCPSQPNLPASLMKNWTAFICNVIVSLCYLFWKKINNGVHFRTSGVSAGVDCGSSTKSYVRRLGLCEHQLADKRSIIESG